MNIFYKSFFSKRSAIKKPCPLGSACPPPKGGGPWLTTGQGGQVKNKSSVPISFRNSSFFDSSFSGERRVSWFDLLNTKKTSKTKVNASRIISNLDKSLSIEYSLDNYHRSNQDTCLVHKPSVFEGQWVQSGDLLADCSASVGGELALGQNILIAYMPWEGYNFEDAILISERLVYDDLYTSIHIERYEVEIRETKLGMEEITREIPDAPEESIRHLHRSGIAKLGSWIEEGDILVGKVTPINKKSQSNYQKLLYTILEKPVLPVRDSSLRAPKGIKAKVVGIQIFAPTPLPLTGQGGARGHNKHIQLPALAGSKESNLKALQKQKKVTQENNNSKVRRTKNKKPKPLILSDGATQNSFFSSTDFLQVYSQTNTLCLVSENKHRNIIKSFSYNKDKKSGVEKVQHNGIVICNKTTSQGTPPLTPPYPPSPPVSGARGGTGGAGEGKGARGGRGGTLAYKRSAKKQQITPKGRGRIRSRFLPEGHKFWQNILFNKKKEAQKQAKIANVKNKQINAQAKTRKREKGLLNGVSSVQVYLAEKRRIQVGDKMAGRHGNKGIISQILPPEDMPFLPDGTPLDMVLNPLGVPSRMNVGQIYECLLGLAGKHLGENFKVFPFDEIYGAEASRSFVYSKLYNARIKTAKHWLFNPHSPGKMRLYDGRTGESFDQAITVGYAYMLRLVHMVDDKIHSRSTGPYSLVTQQPLRGRSKQGGQRLGEMEVWALEGYGAAFTLLEMLTIKSDDMTGRMTLWSNLILNKEISIGTPESFKVLICELQALCLDIGLFRVNSTNKTVF